MIYRLFPGLEGQAAHLDRLSPFLADPLVFRLLFPRLCFREWEVVLPGRLCVSAAVVGVAAAVVAAAVVGVAAAGLEGFRAGGWDVVLGRAGRSLTSLDGS